MNYISTRNKKLNIDFKSIFLRGLAPDGGLFLPKKIKKYNQEDLKKLSKLNYIDLASEIITNFCQPNLNKKQIKNILDKAYSNFNTSEVVEIKKIYDTNLLELYHGPTLAFKDIALQVIGLMYEELGLNSNEINIIVATSGDTGSAAIAALEDKKNINLFVLHPHEKISNIQRKIMTTRNSKNVFNMAVKGNFDDCQKIVKQMFSDEKFREKINMSGVNSINWARIICQIVYYFYAYFKFSSRLNFSVPTGNFGDVYAGYVAKKMGLPINKLIVATNNNDILCRVINTGEYRPHKVKSSLSPSMDIQVASNFERLLFDIYKEQDQKVSSSMSKLIDEGFFKIDNEELKFIKKNFAAVTINDTETLRIIKDFYVKHSFVLDPHTATAVGAAHKIKNDSKTVVLGTAHPYKFLDTIKLAIEKNLEPPKQLGNLKDKVEKFDIIDSNLESIKEYILKKIR
ncbi:MAG: threonine synthase [Candidatus Pelagibacter sp.]|nr:threonine synthase [Candidatus Pelagibacter sp.]OUW23301.1 MAG: threonine synthase [Rickettsiales bacterium TMED174]